MLPREHAVPVPAGSAPSPAGVTMHAGAFVAACVAAGDCATAACGGIPVPALAFGALGMSGVRVVTLVQRPSSDAGALVQGVVEYLRRAPLNVAALTLFVKLDAVALHSVVDALRDNPRHRHIRRFVLHWDILLSAAAGAQLVEATCGMPAMRVLRIRGGGAGVALAAAEKTLRRAHVSEIDVPALVLAAYPRLRWMSVSGCPFLESITLPPSITDLGYAFAQQTTRLHTADLSRTAIVATPPCFLNRTALHTIALPRGLARIAHHFLCECHDLVALDISNTAVTKLGEYFVADCRALQTALLPATLRTVGDSAFRLCPSLAALDLSHTELTCIGNNFLYHGGVPGLVVVLPRTLSSTGDNFPQRRTIVA
jgi:hypothetical protein